MQVIQASILMLILTSLLIPLPFLTERVLDRAIPQKDEKLIVIIFLLFVTIHLARGIFSFALQYVIAFLGQRVVFHVRRRLHEKLQQLPMSFYDRRLPGKIMARMINDVNVIQHLVTGGFITMFTDVVMLIVVIAVMFNIKWQLTMVALLTLPFYALNHQIFVEKIRKVNTAIREKVAEIYGLLTERISGMRMVKSFAREPDEIERFHSKISDHMRLNIRNANLNTGLSAFAGAIAGVGTGLILWYGGRLIHDGDLMIGRLIAFYSFIGYLYGPIVRLTQINTTVQWVMVSIDRIFEVLDEEVSVKDSVDAVDVKEIIGQISFRNASFRYRFGDKSAMQNINLEVMPGMVVGIVGPSGAGKTTFLSLLPRFYDVSSGAILVDDFDIRKIKLHSLRQKIGFVPQESIIFSGTIRSNIVYGRQDATTEEVTEAARAAEIDDFIMGLPDGYDTLIGERGVNLSGGQKQRVAIARALLTKPQILLLDDCTSSLDAETEARIQATLEKIMQYHTCFIVSHRISSVMKADMIIVLKDGTIVEKGTHGYLLNKGGFYARLYEEQYKSREELELLPAS
jgi:subfamily B ATP-binding cassette protein MsbA